MNKLKGLYINYAPKILAGILTATMFVFSIGLLVAAVKWLLKLFGVM